MNSYKIDEIVEWFTEAHREWLQNNRLVSWSEKLGIELNRDGVLDEDQLFHLFVLAVLWNNEPTFKAEEGEQVFLTIKQNYTLENFKKGIENNVVANMLWSTACKVIHNPHIFNLLMFVVNERVDNENVWTTVKQIVNLPCFGDRENDVCRLKQLFSVFNPTKYEAYLTVKNFLIFREIRIQFQNTGKYQYHPAICCIPDSNVRKALRELSLLSDIGNDIDSLLRISNMVAEHFCTSSYELYDLPLFLWYKEKGHRGKARLNLEESQARQKPTNYAGVCPICGSYLVWRRARLTGERYRGCTNYKGGCRWKDRSY